MTLIEIMAVGGGLVIGYYLVSSLFSGKADKPPNSNWTQTNSRWKSAASAPYQTSQLPTTVDEAYAALGLTTNATASEIKLAYRKRMSEYHPDKVTHLGERLRVLAESETLRLNAAYDVLDSAGVLNER